MARAVVEAIAKDKGASGKNIFEKIEALERAQHVRPAIRAQAHSVRQWGNTAAHGDLDMDYTAQQVVLVLTLMNEILNEVYQSPARLARANKDLTNVKQGAS